MIVTGRGLLVKGMLPRGRSPTSPSSSHFHVFVSCREYLLRGLHNMVMCACLKLLWNSCLTILIGTQCQCFLHPSQKYSPVFWPGRFWRLEQILQWQCFQSKGCSVGWDTAHPSVSKTNKKSCYICYLVTLLGQLTRMLVTWATWNLLWFCSWQVEVAGFLWKPGKICYV